MTITIRKAISACSALWVIWLPQVGPIEEMLTCELVSPKAWLRPSCTLKSFAWASVLVAPRAGDRAAHLGDGGVLVGELEYGAALEIDAEIEPAAGQRADADQQDEPGDGVPEAPPADELDRNLTAVQPAANVAEPGHHASFAEVRAGLTAGRGAEPRHGARAPSRAGSRPDSRCPCPKNLVLASRVTVGLVNRNTTTTSMRVVRPRVKAKPLTSPMEKNHSSAEARKDTVSETRMVRRARFQPRSTAVRSVRPSRTSSRSRSKKTTNESAVMPMATMRPAIPARSSEKPR